MSTQQSSKRVERVVLVTAAARGLGLAVARALRDSGDRVHVAWRSTESAASMLAAEFPERMHRADLARAEGARDLVSAVLAREGRLDVLVHPVGEFLSASLESTTPDDLERMFLSNVLTSVHAFDAARAALRATRGTGLFFGVAGLDALRGRRDTAGYAAAKSALLVLVRSWALEEARFGVRVNSLSPGLVPHADSDPMTRDPAVIRRIPLGRTGTPEEVARAALFLCSEDARYMTGVDLPVSGGWLA
ncbi:MAG: SDR family oxidoreductase [Planctomycetes bacterium]|nr:SDR family oxidoreductase [Planctomycetota bacterium]